MRIDFDDVRSRAAGKWLSVWRSLGIDIDESGKHGPCPACGGTDRFRVDRDVVEKGSYFCSGCGPGFGADLVMKVSNVDIMEAMTAISKIVGSCTDDPAPQERRISPGILRKIFMESKPISRGDIAWRYLEKRGLSKIPPCLRHSPGCWNPDTQQKEHALLAVFTMPCSKAVTMQRIFLTSEGDKLPVDKPKKHLPPLEKMTGGAVRLWPVEETIGLAEGVETAIAASEDLSIPVWASLSTALMEAFVPPREVKHLVIIADNDKNFAGQKAAFALANRMVVQNKIDVTIYVPDVPGEDWLDVLVKQKKLMAA